ncbi:MAG: F0F1 ATP synthase subunit gamma [Planctomycetota bacterium]
METLEALQQQLVVATELRGVIKTMKTLAAVNLHRYERAAESLGEYARTIDLGLQMILRNRHEHKAPALPPTQRARTGLLVFGSDQGMCGQLNEQVATLVLATVREQGLAPDRLRLLVVGARVAGPLEDAGLAPDAVLSVPSGLTSMGWTVQEALLRLERWRAADRVETVFTIASRHLGGTAYQPECQRLLPLDQAWLDALEKKGPPSRTIPLYTLAWDSLFAALIYQYLYVSVHRALTESLTSENASRLGAMQNAEKNIDDRAESLTVACHRVRQQSVTGELLDIISGFEALIRGNHPQ